MIITAWRLVREAFRDGAFDGRGARDFPGRWNPEGLRLVYTAAAASLAVLEVLVGLNRWSALGDFVLIPARFDEKLAEALPAASLPADWKTVPVPQSTRILGADWARSRRSAVLAVPSAVLPIETVYLLNPLHPDFAAVEVGESITFSFDLRLRR
jgi:RES domain-containing protein